MRVDLQDIFLNAILKQKYRINGNKMCIAKNQEFISNRIYELRVARNLSARELSFELGMSASYINKIENGKAMPSLEMLFIICMYFDITPEEFFRGYNGVKVLK